MMIKVVYLFSMIFFRLPARVVTLLLHFSYFIPGNRYALPNRPSNFFIWFSDLIFYIFDCLGFGEMFTIILFILFARSRSLTSSEIKLIRPLFGDSIRYNDVLIISGSNTWIKKYAHAFVLFNTIHHHGELLNHILLHEMVHVYQYQHFGSMYIGRALLAQHFGEGYEYGSSIGLYNAMISGKKFTDFNFEQQGQIVEDYYLNYCGNDELIVNIEVAVYRFYLKEQFGT